MHPNTFHLLFYTHALPGIYNFKFEIYYFTSNVSGVASTQIKLLRQFQSSISQFQKAIDDYIQELDRNIDYLSNFNSFVTKCAKSYLCQYIKSLSNHYNSCHESLKENVKTFECIQSCVKHMSSLINGDTGSEKYLKNLFIHVSSDDTKNTISWIKSNLPVGSINSINIYLTMIEKFLDPSNSINTTLYELTNVKNYTSQFTGHILNYINRIKWHLIPRLSRLVKSEYTIKRIKSVSNGTSINNKYEEIKPKVKYCESSLRFEAQRLGSIWNNARMLQFHLEKIIGILNNCKKIEDKLKDFKKKLENMKQNKKNVIDYLSSTVTKIICNLCEIKSISNSLNSAKEKVSITTIKQDIAYINTSIEDINNILYVIKSWLIILDPIRLGIDCSTVNDIESCIKEIVSDIHGKYCCLSSDVTTIFTGEPCKGLTPVCKLSEIVQCGCTSQTGANTCQSCQTSPECQDCQFCESLKQLVTQSQGSNFQRNLEAIKKVICRLTDGKTVDGCQTLQGQQSAHSCQAGQQAQTNTTCQSTSQQAETDSNICKGTNIGELIKSTLDIITKCQNSSSAPPCAGKEEAKCEDTLKNGSQTSGSQQAASGSTATTSTSISCNELHGPKFWLDNMINKCNCEKLKEVLNGGRINLCINLFKCLIITNFRELFKLYSCFDKSILNQISCLTEKLEQIKFDLRGMISINNRINLRLYCIKGEINKVPKQFKSLETTMKSAIRDLECAIEGVTRNLIRCTLLSLTTNIRAIENGLLDSDVYGFYSVSIGMFL